MDGWLGWLREELRQLETDDLLRRLRPVRPHGRLIHLDRQPGGSSLVNLASNDYLALADHPHLKQAAVQAIREYGTGAGASRLVTGHHPCHSQVESRFAEFKHAEAALLCPTGYMANLAVLTSLAGRGDLICLDKRCHASLLDAARATDAEVRVYPHLQTTKLARLLRRHAGSRNACIAPPAGSAVTTRRPPRGLIVTDSVFSMDGDTADLPGLCDLADQYEAILVVDEAHGTGVLGETGAGLCELQGVSGRVDVVVSTASKALGGLGGVVTARREVIETLVNRARSFIYTTAVSPAQAATIDAALDVIRDEPQRRERLGELSTRLRLELSRLNWAMVSDQGRSFVATPIVPLVVGAPSEAIRLADHLRAHGLFAPAIRPPTVALGTSRVRVSLRADLEDSDLDRLIEVLSVWGGSRP